MSRVLMLVLRVLRLCIVVSLVIVRVLTVMVTAWRVSRRRSIRLLPPDIAKPPYTFQYKGASS